MVLVGTAVLANRRVAARNRDEVVVLPGPPLWQLLFEELAHEFEMRWKRVTHRACRLGKAMAAAIPFRYRTTDQQRGRKCLPTTT